MVLSSYRIVNLAQAIASAGLIIIAIAYFQNFLGLEPCYLCVTQRVFVVAVGVICGIAAIHNPAPKGQRIYAGLTTATAIVGGYFSGKQLWLQSLPEDQVPACGIPVDYLFDSFSASEAVSMLLRGDGNCAEVQWQLLGLSMPAWVMVSFAGFAAIGIVQFLRKA
ncbi:MAG: disulfide bond formation protein B [Porticoccaceae bacterium]|nr:disulfide bond formation protein B [Porticoccaceae bacterium]MDG1311516.1 disulfide bond formation protein B [Porticoccaceae bacterium]